MATMVQLLQNVDGIVQESYDRKKNAEAQRDDEFRAALKIQSWFRATKSRCYLKYLNNCATTIQKRWRGFLGRRFFRILLRNSVYIMKLNFYNSQATIIQKIWRGFYTRKYMFNYYSRKRYLEGLQVKNEIIRAELQEFADIQNAELQKKMILKQREKEDNWARKNHHLKSTVVIPGIYNSPFLMYPSELEIRLHNSKPLDHPKEVSSAEPFDPTCKSYDLPKPKVLPPIPDKKQGPFRDPKDVQDQRYKPFQPSLRVATNYTSVEEAREKLKQQEWVDRLNDNQFLPFSKQKIPYDPLLHTSSQYGHLPYGTNYFRETIDPVVTKPFRTLVPPIPLFDKLNDTYSQGQV
ncbi:spermatogenesis-associated protein 17-like isoform X2 [Tubulanus polymorphus]|uniref:spermatogenesis-associated protein 17-like isoform X2 n=1 Tax=Tubulanus polymorphus TaxID=672921 RepID=UPI003DA446BD